MRKLIVISSFFVFTTLPLWSQEPVLYTPDQLKQDLSIFSAALREAHPGLYRYQSKKEVEAGLAFVNKQLNKKMTEEEFYRLLNRLVANICCAHTKFHRDGKPDDPYAFHEKDLFPLKLYFQPKGKAYVLRSYTQDSSIPSRAEVIRINGKSINDIKDQLFQQITADGHVTSSKYQELNQFFAGYYANFIGTASEFIIDYKERGSDKTCTKKLEATTLIQIKATEQTTTTATPFHLSFPEREVALMKIDVFVAPEDQFENFLSTSFNELRTRNTKHLILDLRNNEGGIDRFGARLYAWLSNQPFRYYDRLTVASIPPYSFASYTTLPDNLDQLKQFIKKQGNEYIFTLNPNLGIQQPEKNPFTGNLYILQNGRSLSVTAEFAAVVRDNRRGIFIGEESGGTVSGNNSGGFALVRLPNTHLGLDVPLLGYYMQLQYQYAKDRGILPEQEVQMSVNDVLEQKDPVLEKALQLIHEVK
jgi:C-terminal processing protease CtpA/Prc